MKDYLDDLATFLGEGDADAGRRTDLLVRAVSNLIDEVVILRSILQDVAEINGGKWQEMYRDMKMNALYSRHGDAPTSVFKYQRFFQDAQESAEWLIPDERKRKAAIDELAGGGS